MLFQSFTRLCAQGSAAIIALVLLLSGCSTMSSRVGGVLNLDTDLSLTLQAASELNLDERDRSSPLFVRFYQLKSDTLFNKTAFIDLYENDTQALGSEFIAKQELEALKPGELRQEKIVLEKDTQFVAVFGEFYQYKDAKYKVIMPVTKNNIVKNTLNIRIFQNKIEILNK